MAEKVVLAEFEFDTTAIEKAREENIKLKQAILELRKENQETNKSIRESGEVSEVNARKLAENDEALKKLNATYRDNSKVISANASSVTQLSNALNQEVKTENQAIASNRRLIEARKKVNITTKEGQKAIAQINEKINANNKLLDSNADKYSAQKRNIGNYGDDLRGLSPTMNKYIMGLSKAQTGLKAYQAGLKSATTSTNIFKVALISTGIGAIVVALGFLITAFMKTQSGIDAVTRVLTPLKVVMQSLWGVVEKLGTGMVDAFSNPKQAVSDLWDSIKQNLVNRLEGLGKLFKSLGKIISSGFTDGYEDFANATLQIGTGVEDVIGKTKRATEATGKFFDEAISRGKEIAELNIEIEKREVNLSLLRERNLNIIKEQELIAKDKTKTDKERNEALEIALLKSKEIENVENGILDLKIQKTKLDHASNDTSREEQKALAELEAERERNKTKNRAVEMRFLGTKNQLAKEVETRAKKAIDKAIKDNKTLLNIYIEQSKGKLKTMDDELKFAEQLMIKKLEIAKKELDAKKKTPKEYELEVLKIKAEFLGKQNELTLMSAENELQIFKDAHQRKLDANLFFSEELLKQEQERLDAILQKETEYLDRKLELGLIKQYEYNEAIRQLNEENRLANEDLELQRTEAKKEQDAIDLENQRAIDEENFQNKFAVQSSRLEAQRKKEVEEAEKTGADINLINEKYAGYQKTLEQQVADFKDQMNSRVLGSLKSLFGESSALGKVFAGAEIVNNTVTNATKAFQQASVFASNPLTAPLAINANIQGGIIIATGAAQLAKLVTPPKAEQGMLVGKTHEQGGIHIEAEHGEAILNAKAMANPFLRNIASAINVSTGGVDFSTPNNTGYFADGGVVERNLNIQENIQQDIKVVNVVEDTFNVMDENVIQVQNRANL